MRESRGPFALALCHETENLKQNPFMKRMNERPYDQKKREFI